jgi:hypothetical protein
MTRITLIYTDQSGVPYHGKDRLSGPGRGNWGRCWEADALKSTPIETKMLKYTPIWDDLGWSLSTLRQSGMGTAITYLTHANKPAILFS